MCEAQAGGTRAHTFQLRDFSHASIRHNHALYFTTNRNAHAQSFPFHLTHHAKIFDDLIARRADKIVDFAIDFLHNYFLVAL